MAARQLTDRANETQGCRLRHGGVEDKSSVDEAEGYRTGCRNDNYMITQIEEVKERMGGVLLLMEKFSLVVWIRGSWHHMVGEFGSLAHAPG